jgi:hypothetical protein
VCSMPGARGGGCGVCGGGDGGVERVGCRVLFWLYCVWVGCSGGVVCV